MSCGNFWRGRTCSGDESWALAKQYCYARSALAEATSQKTLGRPQRGRHYLRPCSAERGHCRKFAGAEPLKRLKCDAVHVLRPGMMLCSIGRMEPRRPADRWRCEC